MYSVCRGMLSQECRVPIWAVMVLQDLSQKLKWEVKIMVMCRKWVYSVGPF